MNLLPQDYTLDQINSYLCSINSYLGYMRHCSSYAIRKKVLLMMDRRFYRHIYIRGRYESVALKNKYKRLREARKILAHASSKKFDYLMENYDKLCV